MFTKLNVSELYCFFKFFFKETIVFNFYMNDTHCHIIFNLDPVVKYLTINLFQLAYLYVLCFILFLSFSPVFFSMFLLEFYKTLANNLCYCLLFIKIEAF